MLFFLELNTGPVAKLKCTYDPCCFHMLDTYFGSLVIKGMECIKVNKGFLFICLNAHSGPLVTHIHASLPPFPLVQLQNLHVSPTCTCTYISHVHMEEGVFTTIFLLLHYGVCIWRSSGSYGISNSSSEFYVGDDVQVLQVDYGPFDDERCSMFILTPCVCVCVCLYVCVSVCVSVCVCECECV